MATDNKKTDKEISGIDNLNESLTGFSDKVEKNKKTIGIIIAAVIIVAIAVIGYVFYSNRSSNESAERFSNIEPQATAAAAGNDSVRNAKEIELLKSLASSDKGKTGATLANIDLAGKYYEAKKYNEALEAIKLVDTDEPLMKANLEILAGDCYVNLKKYPEAITEFDKAVSTAKENPETAVRALLKKATVLDAQKKYNDVIGVYDQIIAQYPDQVEVLKGGQLSINVEALKARAEARAGK